MAQLRLKLEMDPTRLLARIEALADYVGAAPVGDPVAELAAEVGVIDVSTDVRITTASAAGTLVATFEAAGNLARMLEAFEARVS